MENDLYGMKEFPCTCDILECMGEEDCPGCIAYRESLEKD